MRGLTFLNVIGAVSQSLVQTKSQVTSLTPQNNKFNSNKLFDIVYINLERNKDRSNYVDELLTTANCKFSKFNGVDGAALYEKRKTILDYTRPLNLNDHSYFIDLKHFENHTAGMLGCKFSHYLNIRNIERLNSDKPTLVLEDDVDLECDFVDKLEKSLKDLPEDWDILLITQHYNTHKENKMNNNSSIVKVGYFFECLGFLVNKKDSARKIADVIEMNCNINAPIDLFLASAAINNKINVYALKTKLAVQRRDLFKSSIPTSQEIHQSPLVFSLDKYLTSNMIKANN